MSYYTLWYMTPWMLYNSARLGYYTLWGIYYSTKWLLIK